MTRDSDWGTPHDLADIGDEHPRGTEQGVGGGRGATGGDLDPDSTGGTQSSGVTPERGLGVPDLGESGAAPGGPSGEPGALTQNADVRGGSPTGRTAGGRREAPEWPPGGEPE